jgi:hypothetical protein
MDENILTSEAGDTERDVIVGGAGGLAGDAVSDNERIL